MLTKYLKDGVLTYQAIAPTKIRRGALRRASLLKRKREGRLFKWWWKEEEEEENVYENLIQFTVQYCSPLTWPTVVYILHSSSEQIDRVVSF